MSYRPDEDWYPDHRCQCLHLDVQHKDKEHGGCPWCDCEEYQHWTEAA